jgi:hypothetical protein
MHRRSQAAAGGPAAGGPAAGGAAAGGAAAGGAADQLAETIVSIKQQTTCALKCGIHSQCIHSASPLDRMLHTKMTPTALLLSTASPIVPSRHSHAQEWMKNKLADKRFRGKSLLAWVQPTNMKKGNKPQLRFVQDTGPKTISQAANKDLWGIDAFENIVRKLLKHSATPYDLKIVLNDCLTVPLPPSDLI